MNDLEPLEIDTDVFLYDQCALPPLPGVVNRLRDMMCSEEINVSEIANLIKTDPALVAQILKIVNSAYYSFPQEILEINFAIAYLGISEVYRVVLALSVINTLAIGNTHGFRQFWKHSNYTALCTKFITSRYAPLLPLEKLWSAAILHDIGKLIYMKFFPEHYTVLTNYCAANGELFSHAEAHFALPSSADLGMLLCERWRLPGRIKDACQYHSLGDLQRRMGNSVTDEFIRMVTIGNLLAILLEDPLNNDVRGTITSQVRIALKLDTTSLLDLMDEIRGLHHLSIP